MGVGRGERESQMGVREAEDLQHSRPKLFIPNLLPGGRPGSSHSVSLGKSLTNLSLTFFVSKMGQQGYQALETV